MFPTDNPSVFPTDSPSVFPTPEPTAEPTVIPTLLPSPNPSAKPTNKPSGRPSLRPSAAPSLHPTRPTAAPSGVSVPSPQPTQSPTIVVPPPPELLSAVFSTDGSQLSVTFDSPTNQGSFNSLFPCSFLFNFDGTMSALCQWLTPSSVTVYLGSGATLLPGGGFEVLPSVIKAQCPPNIDCSLWNSTSSISVVILPPAHALSPTVVITAPSVIGSCAALTVDVSNSVGAGGRPWASFAIIASSPTGIDVGAVQGFLDSQYRLVPPTPIPSSYLSVGNYTFDISLCNFLGVCGSSSVSVFVTATLQPLISVFGNPNIQINRNGSLIIQTDAYVPSCNDNSGRAVCASSSVANVPSCNDNSVSRANLALEWTVWTRTSSGLIDTSSTIVSTSKSPWTFSLNPFTLNVKTTYQIQLRVTHMFAAAAEAAVSVYVAQGNIVAIIAGGQIIGLPAGSTILLDGSQSFDSDYPSLAPWQSGLSFSWTCSATAPSANAQCGFQHSARVNASSLEVSALDTDIDTQSLIIVTVFDSTRTSQAQALVQVISRGAPTITILTSFSSDFNGANSLKIESSTTFSLSGSASWTVDNPDIDLGTIALTAVTQPLPYVGVGGGTQSFGSFLILAPNSLPPRSTLTFTLTCVLDNGLKSAASVAVRTNGPPLPGLFTVSPPSGQELTDVFTFTASQWLDPG